MLGGSGKLARRPPSSVMNAAAVHSITSPGGGWNLRQHLPDRDRRGVPRCKTATRCYDLTT